MRHKSIQVFIAALILTFASSAARANPCDDPAKAKALGTYCKPAKLSSGARGLIPKLDPERFLKTQEEAPGKIALATNVSETSKLPTRQQINILKEGISAASLMKDDQSLITFSERLQNEFGTQLYDHRQPELASAYFNLGRNHDAYRTYKNWFTPDRSLREKYLDQVVIVAEEAGDLAFAAERLDTLLAKSKRRFGNYTKRAELYIRVLRLRGKLGDRAALETRTEELLDLFAKRFKDQPLSKAHFAAKASEVLHSSNFGDLATTLETLAANPVAAELQSRADKYETECAAKLADACLNLIELYRGENARSNERFSASQRACALGETKGCYTEAAYHQYGTQTEKNEAKAHALFAKACDDNMGDACHGAAMIHLEGGALPDLEMKRYFHKLGCEKKSARSCYSLANSLMRPQDTSVDSDPKTARKYYKKACKLGERSACIAAKAR